MEVSIDIHQCSATACLQTRRLDLIVMPILTLGFFCLRNLDPRSPPPYNHTQTWTNTVIQNSIVEILPMLLRTVSRFWRHRYRQSPSWTMLTRLRYRFLQGYWYHSKPVQCRTADAFTRHRSLRDSFQHDSLPDWPWQMVDTSTLSLRYRQYIPGIPTQLRVIHRNKIPSWCYWVWLHPWRSMDYIHLVY
jgi:hypothetical protein